MRTSILKLYEEAVRIRRELHKIPEKGFDEVKTSDYIYRYLLNLNVFNVQRVAKTGVVAFIPGESSDTIAFRADMDGLSVNEENNLIYNSQHEGMMHACGHDGHMTILLLFAKYIMENNILPSHNVLLIFQPAEEGPGGAKVVVEEGVLDKYNVVKVYGCHIMPKLDEGKIGCRPNAMMAQNGEFYITVIGQSSHAASPHKGVDSIMISANLIVAINSIVSRSINPLKTALLSIGTVNGGNAVNVVADKVRLGGTMRAFDEDTFKSMKNRLSHICAGYEQAFNCKIELEVVEMYPPVFNDEELYREFKRDVEDMEFVEVPPMMIAEDFSFYQKRVPGLFFYLGSKNNDKGFVYDLHHGKFNFDEHILLRAVEIYARIIERQ